MASVEPEPPTTKGTPNVGSEVTSTETGPYTVWSKQRRTFLVLLLGYLGLASSMTANIYLPLLDLLARRYEVSQQQINLTVTLFFVFQAIAPSFWSPISDTFGRRPVYLAFFTVYTAASLGLSIVDKSYPALLLLRGLQSIGGSAVVSVSYAFVADIAVHAERGRFLSPMMTAMNVGTSIGPIIGGGAVLATDDPRWCFRALAIYGGSGLLLIGWLMPETNRSIVGNGAVPAHGIWRTWWDLVKGRRRLHHFKSETSSVEKGATPGLDAEVNLGKTGRGTFRAPNPLAPITLALSPETFLALWLAASPYGLWFCIQASISPIFSAAPYHYNPLYIGLCFLTGGAGIIIGGFVAGGLMDHNYQHVARAAGLSIDRLRGDDVNKFPIERARSRGTITIVAVTLAAVVGYGWAIDRRAHPAVLLVLQGVLACRCTVIHQTYSALAVDIYPDKPGTAAAANNVFRCTLSAVAMAALDPLARALGYGWLFTLLGGLDGVGCVVAVLLLRWRGWEWRRKRVQGHD